MEHRAWRDSLLEIAAFPASSAMKRNSSPAFVISQPRSSTDLEIYIEPLFYLDSFGQRNRGRRLIRRNRDIDEQLVFIATTAS